MMSQGKKSLFFVTFSGLMSIIIIYIYLSLESQLDDLRRETRTIERHLRIDGNVWSPGDSRQPLQAQDVIVNNPYNPSQQASLEELPEGDNNNNNNQANNLKLRGVMYSSEQLVDAGDPASNLIIPFSGISNHHQQSLEDSSIVIYNRVPKTASTTMMGLVYDVCKTNNIHVIHINTTKNSHIMTLEDQSRFVTNVTSWTDMMPAIYHGHFAFIDFTRFGRRQPIYINVIRDPIERLISYYYFLRYGDDFNPHASRKRKGNRVSFDDCVKSGEYDCDPQNMWLQIPFFCGQSYFCWIPGSQVALDEAKKNVISKYLVVGVTEEMGDFVSVLEVVMPKYFVGIANLYQNGSKSHLRKTFNKEVPNEESLRILRNSKIWRMEQEFYDFVKMQFHFVKRNIFKTVPGRPVMPVEVAFANHDNLVLEESSIGLKRVHHRRVPEYFYDKIRPKTFKQ